MHRWRECGRRAAGACTDRVEAPQISSDSLQNCPQLPLSNQSLGVGGPLGMGRPAAWRTQRDGLCGAGPDRRTGRGRRGGHDCGRGRPRSLAAGAPTCPLLRGPALRSPRPPRAIGQLRIPFLWAARRLCRRRPCHRRSSPVSERPGLHGAAQGADKNQPRRMGPQSYVALCCVSLAPQSSLGWSTAAPVVAPGLLYVLLVRTHADAWRPTHAGLPLTSGRLRLVDAEGASVSRDACDSSGAADRWHAPCQLKLWRTWLQDELTH
jgi:hypothetical protein